MQDIQAQEAIVFVSGMPCVWLNWHTAPVMHMSPPLFTEACEDRDFAEWHQGCPWCAVWVVRAEHAAVQAMVDGARAQIPSALLPRYARQPHITVAYRGLMAGNTGHARAEFSAEQLVRDRAALQAAQLRPFTVEVGGAASFTTVPYVAVAAQHTLLQAHDALHAQAPYPGWQYVPHVTVGHYAKRLPMDAVLQALAQSPENQASVTLEVDALWLARYRTCDIAGPLFWEGRFDLRTQRYIAAPDALLEI